VPTSLFWSSLRKCDPLALVDTLRPYIDPRVNDFPCLDCPSFSTIHLDTTPKGAGDFQHGLHGNISPARPHGEFRASGISTFDAPKEVFEVCPSRTRLVTSPPRAAYCDLGIAAPRRTGRSRDSQRESPVSSRFPFRVTSLSRSPIRTRRYSL
jgi:hypothetical protein